MKTTAFLEARKIETITILEIVKNEIGPVENDIFNTKPEPTKWSIGECIQHLNLTLNIYIPQMVLVVKNKKLYPQQKESYSYSFLGSMAVKSMNPKEGNIIPMKMKTFKMLKPEIVEINKTEVLNKFVGFQDDMLSMIEDCKDMNLEKPKINTAAGLWLKMRFGDALHFMVAHNRRHILQAQNVLKIIS